MKVMSDTCMHGGDIRGASKKFGVEESSLTDFSSNVNVFGLSPAAVKAVRGSIRDIKAYPDRRCSGLIKALSGYLGIKKGILLRGMDLRTSCTVWCRR